MGDGVIQLHKLIDLIEFKIQYILFCLTPLQLLMRFV